MRTRTDARREAIVQVASKLFREAGFERASMAQIAERVGGSKATLYGYFPSKEALFVAVTQAAGDNHLIEAVASVSDSAESLERALIRFGISLTTFLCEGNTLASQRMVLGEAGSSRVGELFWDSGPRRAHEAVTALLAARMERGELRRADPRIAAFHLLALLSSEHTHRLFHRDNAPPTPTDIQRSVSSAVAVFMRGYRPEE